MAKANKSSLEDAINIFKDVMQRASLSDYFHVNRTLVSKNEKENSVIIPIDQTLWNSIMDIPEIKDHVTELTTNTSDDMLIANMCSQCNDVTISWLELDSTQLYSGNIIKVKIEGFDYDVSISKALIPLKLKKSEFTNISYRVFPDTMILALKKRFDYPLEEHGFSIIRLFKII